MKCMRTDTDAHMWTHTHTHNKVPECRVYVIVFEMVMHEPVNQLAADKRPEPCPENTHTGLHAYVHPNAKLPPFRPDVISTNRLYSLMFCLLSFSFYSLLSSLFFFVFLYFTFI